MRSGTFQLARIFGIRVGASGSWFAVLFFMIYSLEGFFADELAIDSTGAFLVALAAAVLFFGSIVLHELGHALVARRSGMEIAGIDLWFFGGLAKLSRDSQSPGEELRIAAAGPIVTALVILASFGAAVALGDRQAFLDTARFSTVSTSTGVALLGWLASVNLFVLVFNLVPAFPLDGGRIARAAAWKLTGDRTRGTRFSARLGQGFAYLLIGVGLYLAFTSDPFDGIWFAVLGFFLGQGARAALVTSAFQERIEGVTAGDLMDPSPVTLPGDVTAARADEEFFTRYGWPWFAVVDADGRFLGILDHARVEAAMADGRPALPVAELLDPAAREAVGVADATPLEALLGSPALAHLGALVVTDDEGRLSGVVTTEQVRRALVARG